MSRKAVSKRVASGSVIACPLASGVWVFPTWQYTREGTADPALLVV